jgi:hypothetical protein
MVNLLGIDIDDKLNFDMHTNNLFLQKKPHYGAIV